jgi:tRNA (mo5U34)-methyltransferase
MDAEELRRKVASFRFWYHKIDLGQGVVTPGQPFDAVWDMIRHSRATLDYKDKSVLDIASFDGMWAFEAEKLGASTVVATDCYYETYRNFLFCREALGSQVIPYYNVSPYALTERLDVFLEENWESQRPYDRLFDIVQHLGLLYHLRDPLLTLSQARSVIRTGGLLLIETAAIVGETASFMVFNGVPPGPRRIYPDDLTTWWAPTVRCLEEMLRASMFEPIESSVRTLPVNQLTEPIKQLVRRHLLDQRHTVSRVSLVARAMAPSEIDPEYYRELTRTYRNPGLVIRDA